jgi:hypothetical protein
MDGLLLVIELSSQILDKEMHKSRLYDSSDIHIRLGALCVVILYSYISNWQLPGEYHTIRHDCFLSRPSNSKIRHQCRFSP